ncbi:hypothetical protein [Legionella sp. km772]|uniref:hypothetical protein n=1 Tax=Legionella sp. km772 TaxID=2498111 RepID=UPI000F8E1506|nr:hypothetical protein [Legionella sp. km772]RUR05830.1 hypothetical protein ELY15_13875 [Legionella sp. km772]
MKINYSSQIKKKKTVLTTTFFKSFLKGNSKDLIDSELMCTSRLRQHYLLKGKYPLAKTIKQEVALYQAKKD